MKLLLLFMGLAATLNEIRGHQIWAQRVRQKSSTARDICSSQPSWQLIPDPDNCQKFYVCSNREAEEYNCAAGYYFDKIALRCKPGNCPSAQTPQCTSGDLHRISDNCNAYAVCDNGKLLQGTCGPNEFYNPSRHWCEPITNNVEHKCSCILPQYAVLPNADNCETYFMCVDGIAKLQQCPKGEYYDEYINACLPDVTGVCLMAPTMRPRQLQVWEKCDPHGNKAHTFRQDENEECDKFYLCLNGRVYTQWCPKGLWFDEEGQYCRYDGEKKCGLKKIQQQEEGESEEDSVQRVEDVDLEEIKKSLKEKIEHAIDREELTDKEETEKLEEKLKEQLAKEEKEKVNTNKKQKGDKKKKQKPKKKISKETNEEDNSSSSALEETENVKKPSKKGLYDKLSSKFVNI